MKRLLLCLAAVLLVVSACGDLDSKAATVNGEDIDDSSVEDELKAIGENRRYRESIEQQSQIQILGITQTTDTFDTAFVAQVLTRQIVFELIQQEAEKRKVEPSDEVRQVARQDMINQVGGEDTFEAFDESYRQQLIEWNTAALALQADLLGLRSLSASGIESYFRRHADEFEEACTRHVLVEDEADANEIRKQALAGVPFENLAREHSLDTGSAEQGGAVGCALQGFLQPEYEEAAFSQPIGQVGMPVESARGWHVIRVDARRVPPLDQVRDDVQTRVQTLAEERLVEFLRDAVFGAKVDVNPRFGSWNELSGRVDAPGAPTAGTGTTTPAAPPGQ